jgi:hypothetical protein
MADAYASKELVCWRQRTMMNVCFNCGIYRADKLIDPDGPYAGRIRLSHGR